MQFIDNAELVTLDGAKNEVAILRWDSVLSKYVQKVQTLDIYSGQRLNIIALGTKSRIMKGREYEITDASGLISVILTGISSTELSKTGRLIQYCPATYATKTDVLLNVWLGIWQSTLTPSGGDYCIWGGKVWKNASGMVGSVVDAITLSADWNLVIPDATSELVGLYIRMSFDCVYNIKADWVEKQYDNQGNVMGVSHDAQANLYHFAFNPATITDWNMGTNFTIFKNNDAIGIFNTIPSSYYYSSSYIINGFITDNKTSGIIQENFGNIINNKCKGNISGVVTLYGNINDNICDSIIDNQTSNSLSGNIINGSILRNTSAQINGNTGSGSITDNTATTSISYNILTGDIKNCISANKIEYNSAVGDLDNLTDATFPNLQYVTATNALMARKETIDGSVLASTQLTFLPPLNLGNSFGAFVLIKFYSGTPGTCVIKVKNAAGDNSVLTALAALTSTYNIVIPLSGTWANGGSIEVEVTTISGGAFLFNAYAYGIRNPS